MFIWPAIAGSLVAARSAISARKAENPAMAANGGEKGFRVNAAFNSKPPLQILYQVAHSEIARRVVRLTIPGIFRLRGHAFLLL